VATAAELDGRLIRDSGRRLLDLSAVALLHFAYACLVEHADADQRKKIDAALTGRLGSRGGILTDEDDESIPAPLRGKEAPEWWTGDQGAIETKDLDLGTSGGVRSMPTPGEGAATIPGKAPPGR